MILEVTKLIIRKRLETLDDWDVLYSSFEILAVMVFVRRSIVTIQIFYLRSPSSESLGLILDYPDRTHADLPDRPYDFVTDCG